jgi:hypothetical protein
MSTGTTAPCRYISSTRSPTDWGFPARGQHPARRAEATAGRAAAQQPGAPDDLFASVPAYDARALRTYLAGGFRAIGAEALFLTRPGQ